MLFKAAILTELNKPLVVDEIEVPSLDVGQVLVRVHASGICGAQLGEISGAKGPDPWLPHLLGHEGGGVVEEVGLGVSHIKVGDHVVMHWRKGLGIEAKPPRYRWKYVSERGEDFLKKHLLYAGGGWVTTFNEYAVVSENRLTPVSKALPFEIAALMGCAVTTALGLISNEAKLKIGESIAVAGCGGVGLNVIQGAVLAGGNPVIGIDLNNSKLIQAETVGATHTVMSAFVEWVGITKGLVSNKGLDVFVDCTGSPEVIAAGYDLIRPNGGRMVLVGQPHCDCELSLPNFRRHYCGKTVMDSQGGLTDPNADIPRYVRLYEAGRLPLDRLITHRFPLKRVNEALDAVRNGEAGRCILAMS